MRAKLNLLSAVTLGLLGGGLVSCQTYDFEPVDPLAIEQPTIEDVITARSLKPNMMMLVDTSGSMVQPTQNCGSTTCPTRWKALQVAMQNFLSANGTVARMGLATYPGQGFIDGIRCNATASTEVHVPLPSDEVEEDTALQGLASQANAKIQGIAENQFQTQGIEHNKTGGGTPTNASLRFMGTLPALQGTARTDFVLLLTDGLPNCNPNNANTGPSTECRCTQPDPNACAGQLAKLGCLDKDGSVAAVQELRSRDIKTIVLGFGAETEAGDGPETLNAMAEAGGFARQCPTGTTNCKKFYQAGNEAELAQALKDIIDLVGTRDPCLLELKPEQRPTSEALMVVYINGESLQPGADTWNLTDKGVQFNGATCTRIKNSTTANPVNIEVRVVRPR